jgi:hypothetical protein
LILTLTVIGAGLPKACQLQAKGRGVYIALLEEGTGNREQGTVRSERVSGFKNVLTVMRSAIENFLI